MSLLEQARAHDAADPLRPWRESFTMPDGLVYLDGNSLGALPGATAQRLAQTMAGEWGEGLIRSWNTAGWIDLPRKIGDAIAPLIGAAPGEVLVCDSVSVNLFKLIWAALAAQKQSGRKVILSEPGNFPTDLYMTSGLQEQGLAKLRLVERDRLADGLGEDVALLMLTHVHYKTGAMHDMARLTRAAHEAGALVLWDLSHSVGAVRVDLNACDADFAVGCGYKYLNGGPGAPAFAYAAQRHLATLAQPLTGWLGHASPFEFRDDYEAASGIEKLLAGTPPILSLVALEEGVRLIAQIGVDALVAKSRALTEFFREAMAARVPELPCVSPSDPSARGSHLSFRHQHAFAIVQALIARGVIGDFRDPDILRFGIAPAYNSHADCAHAVLALREVLDNGDWQRAEFAQRAAVT